MKRLLTFMLVIISALAVAACETPELDTDDIEADIQELEDFVANHTDDDTVYDDAELVEALSDLETWQDNHTDNDTVYDDSELKDKIRELEELIALLIQGYVLVDSAEALASEIAAGTEKIYVFNGTYALDTIAIESDLTIQGESQEGVIFTSVSDSNSNETGWVTIAEGVATDFSNITLDGSNNLIKRAVVTFGTSTFDNVKIMNIKSATYLGMGISVYGEATVENSTFENIERIGVHVRKAYTTEHIGTAEITGNTFIGKGDGDWVEYGVEAGASGYVLVEGNTFSNFKGVAASDGSESAGILATDYYGSGTIADIFDNTFINNTRGIAGGYADDDVTVINLRGNIYTDNDFANEYTPAVVVNDLN